MTNPNPHVCTYPNAPPSRLVAGVAIVLVLALGVVLSPLLAVAVVWDWWDRRVDSQIKGRR